MLRIHVGRVLATILLIITALLVAAALRSHASGASDTTSLLGAPPAQLSLTPVEPPHPRTSGFNGTAWCGGLLQTKEADAADACTAGVVLLNLFVLLCCFLALAIICDDYLVPPIEHFCERYQIPDEAAGASFLAFGSSAPEIVIASIATLGGAAPDDPDGDETGLSTVLGSAVLAFGLIPGVSALLAPPPGLRNHSPRANDVDGDFPPELDKGGLLLEIRPLIRDVSFTIIGFSLIFLFGADGLVSRAEALALVGGFFVYMAVVFLPAAKQAKISRNEQASAAAVADKADCLGGDVAASPTRRVGVNGSAVSITAASDRDVENRIGEVLTVQSQHQQVLPTLQVSGTYVDSAGGGYGSFAPVAIDSVDRAERRRICAPPQIVTRVIEQLRRPIEWVCEHTIPHEPEPGEKTTKWLGCFTIGWENNWYVVGFVVSLAYVSLLADVILDCVKFFGDAIGMSEGLEGVTILAWGAQVPDCLASVAMAKKGMGAGAVANAIGSQIINVFIGLGLPYAIAGHTLLNTHGVETYLACLLVCMLTFVGLCVFAMICDLPSCLGGVSGSGSGRCSQPILTQKSARLLCILWCLCNVAMVATDQQSSWDLLGEQYTAPRPWDYMT